MHTEIKAWGRSHHLYADDYVIVDRIEVVKGGYTSIHRHAVMDNLFIVEHGTLHVTEYDDSGELVRRDFVNAGRTFLSPRGVWHRFCALDDTIAVEIYMPVAGGQVSRSDIERRDTGGIRANLRCVTETDACTAAAPGASTVQE